MKSHLIRAAVGSVLLLAASVFVSAQGQAAPMNSETQLTKTDVKALCMHATTAQDHLALASYLRGEAREAENMAQLQEAMVTGYQANPVAGTTTELQMHAKEIVDSARRAAASANEMAKEHEALASRLQENTTATK